MGVSLTRQTLDRLYPAFIRVATDGNILAMGPSIQRVMPDAAIGADFFTHFQIRQPPNITSITQLKDGSEVSILTQTPHEQFRLRGLVQHSNGRIDLFLGYVPDVHHQKSSGTLGLSDFSPADATLDLFVAAQMHRELLRDAETLSTELRIKTDEARKLARFDPLTGLLNRRGFFEDLRGLISRHEESGLPFAFAILDLDGFKLVNDLYGHKAGDSLLRAVGLRLTNTVGPNSLIGRLGGDEFALAIPACKNVSQAKRMGDRICADLSRRFSLDDLSLDAGGSIGMAMFPESASSAEALLERADHALYQGKMHVKGVAHIFTAQQETVFRDRVLIEKHLAEADQSEFHMVYQPIIDPRTGSVSGLEALARWVSPELGPVPPDQFITAAERSGMINKLTELFVRQVLKDAECWPDHISLSINLSALDIASEKTTQNIIDLIAGSGIAAKRLVFEITETALIRDQARAETALRELSSIGARIALDDFGTGYSSLGHLKQIRIDRLKIDGSFTEEIEHNEVTRNIIGFVIGLCANLGIECVAEGITNRRQLDALASAGLPKLQGFYFARPMLAAKVPKFLTNYKAKPVLAHPPSNSRLTSAA